jgi:hypothetical protein
VTQCTIEGVRQRQKTGMTGFDEALRREIRRHADSGMTLVDAQSKIEADALAAELVDTLADLVLTLRTSGKAARVRVPSASRWRQQYSPEGYVLHRDDGDDWATLKRLTLLTPDARIWSWIRNHGHQPAFHGFVPVTGEALRQRQIWVDGGPIAVGMTASGLPVVVHQKGEPPFARAEDVLARVAHRLAR